jgi:hypothetical protein
VLDRRFSPEQKQIIEEAKLVRSQWPLQPVVCNDDLFIIYDDWLEEFADKPESSNEKILENIQMAWYEERL